MRQEVIGKSGRKKELKLRSLSIMEIHVGFLQNSGCFSSWLRLPWEIQVNNQMIARMEILDHKGFEVFKPLRPLHEFGLVSLILLGP